MFLFLSLRESQNRPGTIEPDILPFSNPSTSTSSAQYQDPNTYKTTATYYTASFSQYITDWDLERYEVIRKLACILAVCLHVPINVISIWSYGISLMMFFGIIMSVLNLLCVGFALWKMDVMTGQRLFFHRMYNRTHFDYIILGLLIVYGFSFGVFVFAHMRLKYWIWFFRIVWPCLIATDIFCFIVGWVSTWRDVSLG